MKRLPPVKEMERAYRRRDGSYDGVFFLAVRTTGIFCRPSCSARKPLARNVEYFATVREALFAGFRPCKRCRPLDANGRPPDWVRGLLARVEQAPHVRLKDADLRAMAIDPARARRYFVKNYGMTFHAYMRGRRMAAALERIRRGDKLDDVAIGNGYQSHSGFRETFTNTFGQPPGRGRHTDCIVTAWIETPIGPLVAGATNDGICLLEFTDRRMLESQFATLRRRFAATIVPGENEHLARLRRELKEYFATERTAFSVPLVFPGSAFQRRVWQELLRIPYGKTQSYEDLARRIGSPAAHRAVGRANGQNRIAILIPCHRVINKGGKLGGYGGGLWRKRFLLDLELSRAGTAASPDRDTDSRRD